MSRGSQFRVDVCSDSEGLYSLRDTWQELAALRRSPLLDFEWFDACARTLHVDDTLRIIALYDDNNQARAIAPLVRVRRENVTWIEFLGSDYLYEPVGMLFRTTADLSALYDGIASLPHPVLLRRLPETGDGAAELPQHRLQRGLWLQTESAGTAVLDLDTGWDAFYKAMSSRRRYDHRRAAKRAAAIGDVRFESLAPGIDEAPDLLERAFAIEDRSWKGRQGSSLLRRPQLADFMRRYASSAAADGTLRLFFLHIGDVAVAMALCVEKYDALWFLKIGYDDTYAKCSPGMLQLMYIIEHCCTVGTSKIEHLGSYESWLSAWTSRVEPRATCVHYPANVTGLNLFAADAWRVARSRLGFPAAGKQ